MSSSPAPVEPFAAVQRIRYSVWCAGLSLGLLVTSTVPWLPRAHPWSTGEALSLWELPESGIGSVSAYGGGALGMLMLALALTLLAAVHPARPMVLGALLADALSFLNTMWLHQALGDAAPEGIAPGVAAALVETLALMLGLGLLTLVDSADERDAARRMTAYAGQRLTGSPWSLEIRRRLGHAVRGGMVSVLLIFASALPWVGLRHHREYGEEIITYLSLWDLAGSSAGSAVTPAAETVLSLLVVSFLLVLVVASEPDRFVACWALLSASLTAGSLWWLGRVLSDLGQVRGTGAVAWFSGPMVTAVLLVLSMAVVALVIMPEARLQRRPDNPGGTAVQRRRAGRRGASGGPTAWASRGLRSLRGRWGALTRRQ
ncbi:hypothetical protein ACWEN6_02990 [Sphaerisporangium sp. NPDC004334]